MNKDDIIALVCMAVSFICFLFWVYWSTTNEQRTGRRWKRKFIEKLETIYNITGNNEPLELKYNGHIFKIKVVDEPRQKGLEYPTIPMYKSKLLCINDEPVCRIHYIDGMFRKYKFLEFTNSRKFEEIVELTHGVYLIAYIKDKAKSNAVSRELRPSFYDDEVK